MNQQNQENWIILGRFGRVHGIHGAISVVSFTDPRENIFDYAAWYIQTPKGFIQLQRSNDQMTDKHLLTQIKGYDSREKVAELTNLEIAVLKSELPTLGLDEYYWHELIGMNVYHKDGTFFGTVEELMETGSNDVLLVKGEQRYLIPYLINDVILSIDKIKKEIIVDWDLDF